MENTNIKNSRKLFEGVVTSNKMEKTITVKVESKFSHPKLRKLVVRHKKFHVHDENREAKIGDIVSFIVTKPISKTKMYRLYKIIQKAK